MRNGLASAVSWTAAVAASAVVAATGVHLSVWVSVLGLAVGVVSVFRADVSWADYRFRTA